MSERERSRSPDRGAPPADDKEYPPGSNAPDDRGSGDDDNGAGQNGGGDDDGIKLYVGNLDYGAYIHCVRTAIAALSYSLIFLL